MNTPLFLELDDAIAMHFQLIDIFGGLHGDQRQLKVPANVLKLDRNVLISRLH